MANILLLGYDVGLATELAARILASSHHQVCLCTDEMNGDAQDATAIAVHGAVQRIAPDGSAAQLGNRFSISVLKDNSVSLNEDLRSVDELWLVEGSDVTDALSSLRPMDRLMDALAILSKTKVGVFNYVCPVYGSGETAGPSPNAAVNTIRSKCDAHGTGYRVFRAAALLGADYLRGASGGNDLRRFMTALDDLIAEVRERLPEYFDYQSLHVLGRPDAAMNVIRTEEAAEIIVRVAQQDETLGGLFTVASSQNTAFKSICRILGKLYGAGISMVTDRQELNAIDRLLEERFTATDTVFSSATPFAGQDLQAAGVVDEASMKKLCARLRERQAGDRAIRNRRAGSCFSQLSSRSIERPGGRLDYFVAGSKGPYVLVLNALGQGLKFWNRLVDRLAQSYRIVIWETRGLDSDGEPLRVTDHLDDIDAILAQEQIRECYLLGWCTGPQLAAEFYFRKSAKVLGMAFLNSVFKFGKQLDLETPYSINLEKLCRLLDLRPEMAPSVKQSLSVAPAIDINLESTDSHDTARQVLSLTNVDLRTDVLDPFRSIKTTLNYSRQIVNLLACPVAEKLSQVDIPVLVVGCEYDQVASPAKSREAARLLPNCRYVELQGATHYSIYDRSQIVEAMLRRFFAAPRAVAGAEEQLAAVAS